SVVGVPGVVCRRPGGRLFPPTGTGGYECGGQQPRAAPRKLDDDAPGEVLLNGAVQPVARGTAAVGVCPRPQPKLSWRGELPAAADFPGHARGPDPAGAGRPVLAQRPTRGRECDRAGDGAGQLVLAARELSRTPTRLTAWPGGRRRPLRVLGEAGRSGPGRRRRILAAHVAAVGIRRGQPPRTRHGP